MVLAVSDSVSERDLDFKREPWLRFANDALFMTTAIDNSMAATGPGLEERDKIRQHGESRHSE